MKRLMADRAIARVKTKLGALPCIPNKELLALNGAAKKLVDGLKDGDRQHNDLRFQLGAVLLEGQRAAKSDGHYLAWCASLGIQPRTAQNYTRMARAFGECSAPFCRLKTTTIYRLAAADGIKDKAVQAAKDATLTPAVAAALLKTEARPKAAPSAEVTRVVEIFESFKPKVRAELLALLPHVDLKKLIALLSDLKVARRAPSTDEAPLSNKGLMQGQLGVSSRDTDEPRPTDTYILRLGDDVQMPA